MSLGAAGGGWIRSRLERLRERPLSRALQVPAVPAELPPEPGVAEEPSVWNVEEAFAGVAAAGSGVAIGLQADPATWVPDGLPPLAPTYAAASPAAWSPVGVAAPARPSRLTEHDAADWLAAPGAPVTIPTPSDAGTGRLIAARSVRRPRTRAVLVALAALAGAAVGVVTLTGSSGRAHSVGASVSTSAPPASVPAAARPAESHHRVRAAKRHKAVARPKRHRPAPSTTTPAVAAAQAPVAATPAPVAVTPAPVAPTTAPATTPAPAPSSGSSVAVQQSNVGAQNAPTQNIGSGNKH